MPGSGWDVEMRLDTEKQLSKGRRLELVYALQERARTLFINGHEYTIAPSRRWLELLLRVALLLVLPLLVLYLGLQGTFSGGGAAGASIWVGLALTLAAALGLYLVGLAGWLWLAQRWVPASYLRYQLRRVRLLRPAARWLAQRLLG